MKNIIKNYQYFLIDLNGTLWSSYKSKKKKIGKRGNIITNIPINKKNIDFIKSLIKMNKTIIFLSNLLINSKKIQKSLIKNGIDKKYYKFIYTSGDSLLNYISKNLEKFKNKKFIELSKSNSVYNLLKHLKFKKINIEDINFEEFKKINWNHYDFIVNHALKEETTTCSGLKRKVRFLLERTELPIISVNQNAIYPSTIQKIINEPKFNNKIINLGKPSKTIYEEIFNILKISNKEQILMLGDRLETDLIGANSIGIDCALIIKSQTKTTLQKTIKQFKIKPPVFFLRNFTTGFKE